MPVAAQQTPGSRIEVLVVDDHPPVRQGLELLLRGQGFQVIGSAGSAEEGARMLRARRPDVAVVDIDLGDGRGTDLADRAGQDALGTAIVLYTASVSGAVLEEAAASAASALVLKTSPLEHLADAIRAAAAGCSYIDPSVTSVARALRIEGAKMISKREAQILGQLACGLTTEQVAGDLFLSPETVQTHIRNASRKLGARGRLHAVVLALANGAIDLPTCP